MDQPTRDEETRSPEIVFYDGGCGLCHRAVLFLLRADRDGRAFAFAPLFGETFEREVPGEVRASVPDSLVMKARDGSIHFRSNAVLHAMSRLGRGYRILAAVVRLVPRFLRDLAYDGIARIRHALFSRPKDACPLVPPELRGRFLP